MALIDINFRVVASCPILCEQRRQPVAPAGKSSIRTCTSRVFAASSQTFGQWPASFRPAGRVAASHHKDGPGAIGRTGMTAFLLDVNVLIALMWPAQEGHTQVQHWFRRNSREGWATCPFAE